jgi:uncharacterized DUF497 family protein
MDLSLRKLVAATAKTAYYPSASWEDVEIVVVYVMRGKRRRIISARRAHRYERKDYANHLRDTGKGSHGL